MAESPATQRLFFALWPDAASRDALNRTSKWLHQHWGGRRMRVDTLHLTLAFLGSTTSEQMDAVLPGVARIQADAFELTLDQAGCWKHNRIGWLGCRQPPPQLGNLVLALNEALQAPGLAVDPRPFVPHLTLLRNAECDGTPVCAPVRWPVDAFVLVRSRPESGGAHYEVIRRWALS